MTHRTGFRILAVTIRATLLCSLLLACVQGSIPAAAQIPKDALPVEGAWDITIHTPGGDRYSWLEVEASGNSLVGRFVGMFGSARPVSKIDFVAGTYHFSLPRQYEEKPFEFEGRLVGDRFNGSVTGYAKDSCMWSAVRTPTLMRPSPPKWGSPVELINGVNMDGWTNTGGQSNWQIRDGILVNAKSGANLVSLSKYADFKLHVEFRIPAKSNSGVFLRGRYEVQIEDDEGPQTNRHSMASIYGFFAPCVKAGKRPGEWQTYDITLVGRQVTVVFNGQTVIDRQTIPGITGGALDCNEGAPGPIMVQGDHGRIDFRKMTITPAK